MSARVPKHLIIGRARPQTLSARPTAAPPGDYIAPGQPSVARLSARTGPRPNLTGKRCPC